MHSGFINLLNILYLQLSSSVVTFFFFDPQVIVSPVFMREYHILESYTYILI